jgi:predicted permease
MIAALVPVLTPVLVAIVIGYCWARFGTPVDTAAASQIILNVGTPCLIFTTLSTLDVSPVELGSMAAASLLMMVAFLATGYVLLRVTGMPHRIYLPPIVFGNLGNLALPLYLFAFGKPGLELGLIMFATQSVIFFTINMWLMSGHPSPFSMLKTPHIYAIAAALAFTLTGTVPPKWITNTTSLLGGMTIPIMLIMLGVSLARMKVVAFALPLGVAVAKLVVSLALAWAIAWLLGLHGTARGVIFIACGMPAAVFNYLIAVRYNRQPGEVASYIVISTVVTLLLLPALVPFAWHMAE